MEFKYHGNYCGPGYTGGKFTTQGDYSVAPVDSLDDLCRTHDFDYEFGNSHLADHDLISNSSLGLNKEGLLKLGFIVKDLVYNPFVKQEIMAKRKNLGALKPLTQSMKQLAVAVKNGRVNSSFNNMKKTKMTQQQPMLYRQNAMALGASPSVGKHANTRLGAKRCFVSNKEYLGEIAGSTGFSTSAYPINPGQSATFPWLAKQAVQWEKWGVDSIVFEYRPEVSAFATSGAVGKVMLSCNYDAADSPPTSKQQVEDTVPHADKMPYELVSLRLDPLQLIDGAHGKYVRTGGLPGATDIRLYDGGNLYVSTQGCANASVIGELHVIYNVWFEVPILASSLVTAPANNTVALFQSLSAGEVLSISPETLLLLITVTNGLQITNSGAGLFTVPAGNFLVFYSAQISIAAGYGDVNQCNLLQDGVPINPNGSSAIVVSSAAVSTDLPSTSFYFISTDGSHAYSLQVITGGTGTQTANGRLMFVAV